MKKLIIKFTSILLFLLLLISNFGCKVESDTNTPFTLKTQDYTYLANCSIKDLSQSQPTSVTYLITPAGFDLDELNVQGYKMRIAISYDVNYKKDSLLPDFLYAGSPKYELTILTNDLIGYYEKDLKTTSTAKYKYFSYDFEIVNIKNSKITLTFSTNNVQNIIYFKNIQVEYYCYK